MGLPPDTDQAVKTAAGAAVTYRIVSHGLGKPLSSAFVRTAIAIGEWGSLLVATVPTIIQEGFGLYAEGRAWHAGTCTTIWSKP